MASFSFIRVWGLILLILLPVSTVYAQQCPTGQSYDPVCGCGYNEIVSGNSFACITSTAASNIATLKAAADAADLADINAENTLSTSVIGTSAYDAAYIAVFGCIAPSTGCPVTIKGSSATKTAADNAYNTANSAKGTGGATVPRIGSASLMNPSIGGTGTTMGVINNTTVLGKDALGNASAEHSQPHIIRALVSHYTNTATTVPSSKAACPHGKLVGSLPTQTVLTSTLGSGIDASHAYLLWQCDETFFNYDSYYTTTLSGPVDATSGWEICTPTGSATGYVEYCTMSQPKTVLVSHYAPTLNNTSPAHCFSGPSTSPFVQTSSGKIVYWQCQEQLLETDPYYQALVAKSSVKDVTKWPNCNAPQKLITTGATGYSEVCSLDPLSYCRNSGTNFPINSSAGNNQSSNSGAALPIATSGTPVLPLQSQICPGLYYLTVNYWVRCNQPNGGGQCGVEAIVDAGGDSESSNGLGGISGALLDFAKVSNLSAQGIWQTGGGNVSTYSYGDHGDDVGNGITSLTFYPK